MAAVRTGTASQVAGGGAQSGSTSVTVPSDCTLIIVTWDHWDGNSGVSLTSCGVNSSNFTLLINTGDSGGTLGIGIGTLLNPSTGSQTFDWDWGSGGTRQAGGKFILTYIKDAHTTDPIRDSDSQVALGGSNVSITVTSDTTDIVIASCSSISNPSIDGTVYINNASYNGAIYDASQVTASTTSTTVNMTGENDSGMVGVSIREEEVAAEPSVVIFRRKHIGFHYG